MDVRIEQALRQVLAASPPAHFVAVFGSRAKGLEHPGSDLDVAWLPADRTLALGDELQLQAELMRATGLEVDLVRVDQASTLCRFEVARDGRLVHGSRDSFVRFCAEAAAEYIDYEPVLREAGERFRRRLAAGGAGS